MERAVTVDHLVSIMLNTDREMEATENISDFTKQKQTRLHTVRSEVTEMQRLAEERCRLWRADVNHEEIKTEKLSQKIVFWTLNFFFLNK